MSGLPYSKLYGFQMCASKQVYELPNYSVDEVYCRDGSKYFRVLSCGGDPRTCSPVSKVQQNFTDLQSAKEECDRLQARNDKQADPDMPASMKERGWKWTKCESCNTNTDENNSDS